MVLINWIVSFNILSIVTSRYLLKLEELMALYTRIHFSFKPSQTHAACIAILSLSNPPMVVINLILLASNPRWCHNNISHMIIVTKRRYVQEVTKCITVTKLFVLPYEVQEKFDQMKINFPCKSEKIGLQIWNFHWICILLLYYNFTLYLPIKSVYREKWFIILSKCDIFTCTST